LKATFNLRRGACSKKIRTQPIQTNCFVQRFAPSPPGGGSLVERTVSVSPAAAAATEALDPPLVVVERMRSTHRMSVADELVDEGVVPALIETGRPPFVGNSVLPSDQ
jgi:hypothetical protein